MNEELMQALGVIAGILGRANVSVPIIFGAVAAINAIVKGITGNGGTVAEIADLLEGRLAVNDAQGRAEIERLKAAIGS